ncbi:MAG: hypothetical protein ABIQ16_02380 [Polyangiaceae bacterium]
MQISALARRLLHLVFVLSSSPQALTRPRLERRLGVAASELNPALEELARHGLLDPQRLRLTLPGLALAAASSAPRAAKSAPRARRSAAVQTPIALFSQRETPRAVA